MWLRQATLLILATDFEAVGGGGGGGGTSVTAGETAGAKLEDWPLPSLRDIGQEGRLSTFINRQQQMLEFPAACSSAAVQCKRYGPSGAGGIDCPSQYN